MNGNFSAFINNIGRYIATHFCTDRNELLNGISDVIYDSMIQDNISYNDMVEALWHNYPDFTMELMNYMREHKIDIKQKYDLYVEQIKAENEEKERLEKEKKNKIKAIYSIVYGIDSKSQFVTIDDMLVPIKYAEYTDWGCGGGSWDFKKNEYKDIANDVYNIYKGCNTKHNNYNESRC